MKPIRTSNMTKEFLPPSGHEQDIGVLPYYEREDSGFKEIVSIWELSDEERKAIANGHNIVLGVGWIGGFPPVSLGVTHERI